MEQDPTDQMLFYLQPSRANVNSGLHMLQIDVTSVDYPDYIPMESVYVKVEIICHVKELRLVEDSNSSISQFSPMYQVYEYKSSILVNLPRYEPYPACGFSEAQVSYSLADSRRRDWLEFNKNERTALIYPSLALDLQGKSETVTVRATFQSYAQEVNFKVIFKDTTASSSAVSQAGSAAIELQV